MATQRNIFGTFIRHLFGFDDGKADTVYTGRPAYDGGNASTDYTGLTTFDGGSAEWQR